MTTPRRLLLGSSLALMVACGGGSATAPADTATSIGPDGRGQALLADGATVGRLPSDPLTITSALIVGDSLVVGVSHGGGCARHSYVLAISREFMESNPVQVAARISHDARGDMCRALLRHELRFSLAPLADAYRQAYRVTNGTVVIRLDGWTGSDRLRYIF